MKTTNTLDSLVFLTNEPDEYLYLNIANAILEYGNEEFTAGVDKVLHMIDEWAADADEHTRERMDYYFLKAALYEYAFWDYGYHADGRTYGYTDSLEEWL